MAPTSVNLDIKALEAEAANISEIDAKLASASGNEKQARAATLTAISAENAVEADSLLSKLFAQLEKQTPAVLVALSEKLTPVFDEKFKEVIEATVNAKVAETTTTLTKDEVATLRTLRKTRLNQFEAIKDILESVGLDTSSVVAPTKGKGAKASSGAAAKTGKNKENYQFTMDGKDRPPSQNSLSSLAYYATEGAPKANGETDDPDTRWGTAQLKKFMAENGVNYPEDDKWEVKLPHGKVIGAYRVADEESPEDVPEAPEASA